MQHDRDLLPMSPRWALWFAGALAVAVATGMRISIPPAVLVVVGLGVLLAAGVTALLRPPLDPRLDERPMGKLIAFVGCDGSGKSTLTGQLYRELAGTARVRTCYLGLGSGALGERLKRAPLVGPALERRLARKAGQSREAGARIPGLPTALVIYLFSLVRLLRFKRMLRLRRQGFTLLTDRYPQTECPGFYDGPGLAAATAGSRAVALLVRQERRLYAWMTAFRPDVVIRLNVDAETALARKPEHQPDLVRRKVAITPLLRFAGAPIVDLDATLPYPAVYAAADRIVRRTLGLPLP